MHSDQAMEIHIVGDAGRSASNLHRQRLDIAAEPSSVADATHAAPSPPPVSAARLSAAQLAAAQKVLQHIRPAPSAAGRQRVGGAAATS